MCEDCDNEYGTSEAFLERADDEDGPISLNVYMNEKLKQELYSNNPLSIEWVRRIEAGTVSAGAEEDFSFLSATNEDLVKGEVER